MKKLTFVFFLLFGVLFANETTDMVHKCEVGCKNGNIKYCLVLGLLYQSDLEGVKQDYSKAAKLFKKACDGGEAASCAQLAKQYFYGEIVEKDVNKAVILFKKACDGGYRPACDVLQRAVKEK